MAEAGGLGLVPGPVGEGDVRLEEGGLGGVQEDVGAGEVGWNGCDRYSGSVQKYCSSSGTDLAFYALRKIAIRLA